MWGLWTSAPLERGERLFLVAERAVAEAEPREGAEVAGLTLERLVDIGDGALVVAHQVAQRSTAVPALGEVRPVFDDPVEDRVRLVEATRGERPIAREEHPVHLFRAGIEPVEPNLRLNLANLLRALRGFEVAEESVQRRVVLIGQGCPRSAEGEQQRERQCRQASQAAAQGHHAPA